MIHRKVGNSFCIFEVVGHNSLCMQLVIDCPANFVIVHVYLYDYFGVIVWHRLAQLSPCSYWGIYVSRVHYFSVIEVKAYSFVGHLTFFYLGTDINDAYLYVVVQAENHLHTKLKSSLCRDDLVKKQSIPPLVLSLYNCIRRKELILVIVPILLIDGNIQLLHGIAKLEYGVVIGIFLLCILQQQTQVEVAVTPSNCLSALRTLVLIPSQHAADAIITVGVLINTDHPGNPVS